MRPRIHLVAIFGCIFLAKSVFGAEKNPDVTFHTPPAPLSKDATTSDWPWVLGPTHNEVSNETHILGQFPPTGPKLVWEMNKGEGYAAPVISEGRLVVFHRLGDEEVVDCLDPATGERYWRHKYPTA